MYDRFGYPGLFAAYNAGPGRYGEHLARGRPLPRETRDYVAKITGLPPAPRIAAARSRSVQPPMAQAESDPIFFARTGPEVSSAPDTKPHSDADGTAGNTAPDRAGRRPDSLFLLHGAGGDHAH